MDDVKKRISSLSDSEIKESILQKASDFQPDVYELYIQEAEARGINVQVEIIKKEKTIQIIAAPLWKRLINYAVDICVVNAVFIASIILLARIGIFSPLVVLFIGALLSVTYYVFFEYKFGKTLGKLITKTKVVTNGGTVPALRCIVKRSFSRLIPYSPFVALFTGKCVHDNISNTICVDDKKTKDVSHNMDHP